LSERFSCALFFVRSAALVHNPYSEP
jgi:hypothetical protein